MPLIAQVVGAPPAYAANGVVSDGGDAGVSTLRGRVAAAVAGDVITFTVPTVTLTSAPIVVDKNLTIRGNGPAATTITRSAQASLFRIFTINSGVTVTIDLVTITGGDSTASAGFGDGGGILNLGALTLSRSTVTGNLGNFGGGIANSSASASLTVRNSTVSGNTAGIGINASGGGIYSAGTLLLTNSLVFNNDVFATVSTGTGAGQGGGVWSNTSLTIVDSLISTNRIHTGLSARGAGVYGSGSVLSISNSIVRDNGFIGGTVNLLGSGVYSSAPAALTRVQLSGNVGASRGGGFYQGSSNQADLVNVTLANNTAVTGAALSVGSSGSIIVKNSTISANSSTGTGGGAVEDPDGPISAESTIVANQTLGADCTSTIVNTGNNLESGTSCGFSASGSVQNANPLLAPLAPNGGVSQTMAITSNLSPAVDTGANCAAAPTDQRGFPRVGTCDIGAFEFGSTLVDAAPPACAVVARHALNPRQMDVSATDAGRGLQTISGIFVQNGTVVVPYFTPGSTLSTTLAAVKDIQANPTVWNFHALDQGGNDKLCT